ncbi:MAG: DUF2510 domain-containing protein [Acidimicrobiales bacterium]
MEALGVGLVVLFFVAIFAISIGGLIYWVIALVEIVRIPDHQYRAAGTEKLTWVLVVAIGQIIGALVWLCAKRSQVLAAEGQIPLPPPGWYPDPGGGGWRWWDGVRWTDHQTPR